MKRVWFIFVSIYAVGIVLTGLIVAYASIMDRSLEDMRWWLALVLEGGFLFSPGVFVIACILAGVWSLFSKTPAEEFWVPQTAKRILLVVGILFFVVAPFFLLRDAMFRRAARSDSIGSARVWLALGADINSGESYGGMDALHWAIVYGHQDMVAFLLKNKAEFNKSNILNMVPRGHEQIADLLKQYGAVETGRRDRQDAINCNLPPEQHRYAPF